MALQKSREMKRLKDSQGEKQGRLNSIHGVWEMGASNLKAAGDKLAKVSSPATIIAFQDWASRCAY